MRYLLAILLFGSFTASAQQKLPRILNQGDTAIATLPTWVQSLDSEIDQRLTIKQLKDKLSAYVKKTGEIDNIQNGVDAITQERERLNNLSLDNHRQSLKSMSLILDSCSKELDRAISVNAMLNKRQSKMTNKRNFWRGMAIGQAVLVIAAGVVVFR